MDLACSTRRTKTGRSLQASRQSGGMMNFEHDVPALSKGRQVRILVIAVVAVLAILAVSSVVRSLLATPEQKPAPLPAGEVQLTQTQLASLHIQPAGRDDGQLRTGATGQITVDETRSTPVFLPYSGQVLDVYAEAGTRVAAGQPLLRIRTSDIVDARNALMSADAQRSSAASQLRVAQENASRAEQLYKTAGGALKDYQQAQGDYVNAQSAVRIADAAVAAARGKLAVYGASGGGGGGETVLRAPIGGVLVSRSVAAGQFVTIGGTQPAFVIADLSRVWLVAQVSESDAARVKVGDPIKVTTNAFPGREFDAVINNVGAQLDPVSHRLPVRATIPNPDGMLKPQMFANFTIETPAKAVELASAGATVLPAAATIDVPAVAVVHEGDDARVWTYLGNGRVKSQTVTTGESHDGYVTILSGLKPGTRIVTDGALFVNEAGLGN
jgi:cobalt-zinc-cadmium efflux system membrane fusion protein